MWGNVVFSYQTMPYSQSAGVLHDTRAIGSFPFPNPPPHLKNLFVTVKKCAKTVHTKQCKCNIMAHYWCC